MKESSDNSPRCEVCGHINCHHTPLDQAIAKVEAKAAFDVDAYRNYPGDCTVNEDWYDYGAQHENARMLVLLKAALEIVERQAEAMRAVNDGLKSEHVYKGKHGEHIRILEFVTLTEAQARTLEALKTLGGE